MSEVQNGKIEKLQIRREDLSKPRDDKKYEFFIKIEKLQMRRDLSKL